MKCDLCDNEATVFLTEIVDGNVKKVNLCESCAQAKQVEEPADFALAGVLMNMGKSAASAGGSTLGQDSGAGRDENAEGLSCPACGFTEVDLKKTGRLGCPDCYGVYSRQIFGWLETVHEGSEHVGKKREPNTGFEDAWTNEEAGEADGESDADGQALLMDLSGASADSGPPGLPHDEPEMEDAEAEPLDVQLATLREELDQAIEDEAFEKAAGLRDKIRQLKALAEQSGGA